MFLEFVFVRRLCKSSVTKGGKMVVKTYSLFVIFVHSIDTTPKLLVSWPQARNSSEYQMPFSLENSEILISHVRRLLMMFFTDRHSMIGFACVWTMATESSQWYLC